MISNLLQSSVKSCDPPWHETGSPSHCVRGNFRYKHTHLITGKNHSKSNLKKVGAKPSHNNTIFAITSRSSNSGNMFVTETSSFCLLCCLHFYCRLAKSPWKIRNSVWNATNYAWCSTVLRNEFKRLVSYLILWFE